MRVGIFFGGPSREREVSFMGGRTAYQQLDKALFEPVLVFVSGWGRFYVVSPDFLDHKSIRDALPSPDGFSVYDESLEEDGFEDAEPIEPEWFEEYFDIAFLAMHGPDCEDGAIQGLFEWHKVPYTGPGLIGSAIGINKILQNHLIAIVNGQQKKTAVVSRNDWQEADKAAYFDSLVKHLGLPIVVKAPHQGSSIGVSIVRENDIDKFCRAVEQCFFTLTVDLAQWKSLLTDEKRTFVQKIASLDAGIGYPVVLEQTGEYLVGPSQLMQRLDALMDTALETITLSSLNAEDDVLFEEFISGQEFSCGVIQDDNGNAIALPPTEVYNVESFDFESKYLSNVTKKRIPVNTSLENNRKIQLAVAEVFSKLGINVYSRIDGFLTDDRTGEPGRVLLHDPNTIPGMSPASLIFKQMAEIGLNLTQSLTYLIRQSLRERIRTGKDTFRLKQMLADLDYRLADRKANPLPTYVITFEATDEAFVNAKAEYNRLSAEALVKPILVYQKTVGEQHELPVYMLFKETIADLDTALSQPRHPLLIETEEQAKHVADKY